MEWDFRLSHIIYEGFYYKAGCLYKWARVRFSVLTPQSFGGLRKKIFTSAHFY